ncbi:MAG: substrate-binding domain-containing protein [Candidatus Omnitrophica bacterium]|nr:substrate-binding domain-containing protein [Candidatus Omnitrophota bacterium]
MKTIRVLTVALFMLSGFGFALAQEKITVEGTGDSQQFLHILAQAFEQKHPGKVVEVPNAIGSAGGIKALIEGKCDLAHIARPLKGSEKQFGLASRTFALSPIVFIVSANVQGIENITLDQVTGIFSGKIASWEELGATGGKIYVANRENGDSCRSVLENMFPDLKAAFSSSVGKIIYSTPELIEAVSRHDSVIGYAPMAVTRGAKVRIVAFDGAYPSFENVGKNTYKPVVPLGIAWRNEPLGLAKEFLDFLFSAEAEGMMSENGLIPAQ